MVAPILGTEIFRKGWLHIGGRLKKLARGLVKDGIGDKMDKGNLWIVPGFTILVFAGLWTTKLSKLALEESVCRSGSIYDLSGTSLDDDAQRHCQTSKRYYVAPEEPFSYEQRWREDREVKNPEWILWFWAPIVFVMYVMTRFLWSLLLENQGINFNNVVNASQNVLTDNDGIMEVDTEKVEERAQTIADNFKVATYSRAFAGFIFFEFSLVMAPVALLMFVLPLMVGAGYRTWGLDVARAWWDRKEWHGTTLTPVLGSDEQHQRMLQRPLRDWERSPPRIPLIPRITYCDYNYVSLGNTHTLTYRCYLDANWHERTALFTWVMLGFLTLVNVGNLLFWLEWAFRMKLKNQRRKWVLRKWLCDKDDFFPWEQPLMSKFAEQFRTGNLLLFYYIEAHTDRVVASAFCAALFRMWLRKKQSPRLQMHGGGVAGGGGAGGGDSPSGYTTPKVGWQAPKPGFIGAVSNDYGWDPNNDMEVGDGSSPTSPNQPYYSAGSPSTMEPLLQQGAHHHHHHLHHHKRMSASSDSSTSKSPGDSSFAAALKNEPKPKYTSTPTEGHQLSGTSAPAGPTAMAMMETPKKHLTQQQILHQQRGNFYPSYAMSRRGPNYARNITKNTSRDPLLASSSPSARKSGSASKDKRKREKERERRAQRVVPEDERSGREREETGASRSRCSIM
uniref:Innexin n=1 Tax=Globodera rostochiensis TaxID=31243 RepID=A0A914I5F9_GLORO